MAKFFLCLHVVAAILAVGPVAVAASRFPPALRLAISSSGDNSAVRTLRSLYQICLVYSFVGTAVPVLGLATAGIMGVTGQAWVLVSIGLTAVAAAVLGLLVLPRQRAVLAGLEAGATPEPTNGARLAMVTGVFNLLWVVVTILMIVRPGSTTGA